MRTTHTYSAQEMWAVKTKKMKNVYNQAYLVPAFSAYTHTPFHRRRPVSVWCRDYFSVSPRFLMPRITALLWQFAWKKIIGVKLLLCENASWLSPRFLKIYLFLFDARVWMPVCLYAYHMCAGACGGQMVFDPLELELMAIVSCLKTEPPSYAGAATAPTHGSCIFNPILPDF